MENIEKKSTLDKIVIFEDFIFYQNRITQTFKFVSSVGIKIILFPPYFELATMAGNSALRQFKERFAILIGILTIAIAISVANLAGDLLKLNIKLSVVGVVAVLILIHVVIIKVYQFGKNKLGCRIY